MIELNPTVGTKKGSQFARHYQSGCRGSRMVLPLGAGCVTQAPPPLAGSTGTFGGEALTARIPRWGVSHVAALDLFQDPSVAAAHGDTHERILAVKAVA